jgi:ATP-dependent Clp protease ATP-binding subunit ClpB
MRLLTVADQELAGVRGTMDEFFSVIRTVTDPAAKSAQGKAKLTTALEESNRAVAAVSAAHKATEAGGDGASAALAQLNDTRTGVANLRDTINGLLSGGSGTKDLSPAGIQAQIEETRGAVAAARDKVRGLEGATDVAEGKVFKEIASDTKAQKLSDVTDSHIDEVTEKASQLESSVGKMPKLEEVGTDMIAAARAGKYDNLVGRETEVDQMLTILGRKRKANPILLGDPGVGKTQLVEGLAVRIAKGEVPDEARNLRIYSLTAADLKAAAGAEQGAMEKLIKDILEEVKSERERGENVALFVDELHTLMGAGDAAQQLKPALARGEIKMIGATTWEEFNKHMAKDGALVRRVAPISVEELDKGQVLDVLRSVQEGLSRHHGTVAYDSAIQEVQRLSTKYVRDRKQPDPAIELLDHALSRVATTWKSGAPAHFAEMSNEVGRLKSTIPSLQRQVAIGDAKAAAQLVSAENRLAELEPKVAQMTEQLDAEREVLSTRNDLVTKYLAHMDAGETAEAEALLPQVTEANQAVHALREQYPDRLLTDILDEGAVREAASNLYNRTISAGGADEAAKAHKLGDELASRVIGQKEATDLIAEAMIGVKSGMKDPDAPAGAFLFRGPTGVGKTEAVRVTTEVMTDDVKNMVRIDMGEFSEPHSISRLFGSPPGYVGYDDSPQLAALVKNPEAHVLFDEVEKAHPSIWQKLLPLFEEGRATLGDGTVVDARGATLYMTTNLPDVATATKPGIRDFFSPEFLNRLDGVVQFNHLSRENVHQILDDLLLPSTLKRATENGLDLTVSDAAKERLVDYGFDSAMGARPLKRSLKFHVTQPSGKMILEMKAAGRQVDSAAPQKAILDIDQAGEGFIMRSEDGAITVPIEGRKASEHAPGVSVQTHGGSQNADAAENLEWDLGDDASGAVHPPAPEAQPQLPGGE